MINIAEQFINHLSSLERFIKYNDVIKEYHYNTEREELSMNDIADLIMEVKSLELENLEELDDDQRQLKEILYQMIETNKSVRYFYNSINFSINDDDEIEINFSSELVSKFIRKHMNEHHEFLHDVSQLKNSTVISLVTSIELLISELVKDFIENIDQSNFLEKKSISYEDLLRIGSIEEAKRFLLDQYVEKVFRGSFLDWMNEITNKMKIDMNKLEIIKRTNDIQYINETIQRRHLLIHNGGIVNDLYLSKTDDSVTGEAAKDDLLENSDEYITSRINLFQKVGIVLLFEYGKKKYRNDEDELFSHMNDLLLRLAVKGCEGARHIYKEVANDSKYSHSNQLMSKVNYFLSFKLNNEFGEVEEEVIAFDTTTLSVEYKMAKYILLEDENLSARYFKEYSNTLSDDYFIHIVDWPLIKLARKKDEVSKYIEQRIDQIVSEGQNQVESEGGVLNEES